MSKNIFHTLRSRLHFTKKFITILVLAISTFLIMAYPMASALSTIIGRAVDNTSIPTTTVITTKDIDLHDGTVVKDATTGIYYMYGTMYGCGFQWGVAGTKFCGFGVSQATSLNGPWSTPTTIVSPNQVSPFPAGKNRTFADICSQGGAGCFNPRMIQRKGWGYNDGLWMLYFNAPADFAGQPDGSLKGANAYYVMACVGPVGPCGNEGRGPSSTFKPPLYICAANGDFSVVDGRDGYEYIICTTTYQTFNIERIDQWGVNGQNVGAYNVGGLSSVESPGLYYDATTRKWILTYSSPHCGYCNGVSTSFATADNIMGPYTLAPTTGVSGAILDRRSIISAASCGGQPRTVFNVDGQPYEWIDLWTQTNGNYRNQTNAGTVFAPLKFQGVSTAADGNPAIPAFAQWPCM